MFTRAKEQTEMSCDWRKAVKNNAEFMVWLYVF
jgi:hypothetical protein